MNKVPSFSDAIYDSNNDCVEYPLTSLSVDSQRSKRGTCFSRSFAGLDVASDDSEEEYIPESHGGSSDSEASVELSMDKELKNETMSFIQNRSKFCRQSKETIAMDGTSDEKETIAMDGTSDEKETIAMDGTSEERDDMPKGTEDGAILSSQEEEQMSEASEETPFTPTSSGSSQKKMAKQKDCLMPEVNKVTSPTSTSCGQRKEKSAKKRDKEKHVKRSWTPEECAAVNKHLRKYIVTHQVPGKLDCERCIAAEPQALSERDWKAVKYFVKNRITTMRRKYQCLWLCS
ncbi:uncharacterized protein LOC106532262, partial [Austrofundulus limnaeus]|uniref:Uncharacterized protein LOC106532262 n=1 Tax=Austrofundulus limnaeus TaxID=52670 RepID=A0A2I4CUR9_AUSLI